jgi:hypothetical protein
MKLKLLGLYISKYGFFCPQPPEPRTRWQVRLTQDQYLDIIAYNDNTN